MHTLTVLSSSEVISLADDQELQLFCNCWQGVAVREVGIAHAHDLCSACLGLLR